MSDRLTETKEGLVPQSAQEGPCGMSKAEGQLWKALALWLITVAQGRPDTEAVAAISAAIESIRAEERDVIRAKLVDLKADPGWHSSYIAALCAAIAVIDARGKDAGGENNELATVIGVPSR